MNRWGWFSTKCIVYLFTCNYHSNNVGKAVNKDEPTHLLKLLYPRKWWENCNQCITISNRFCQVKQIEWVQPFFFLFLFICEYKIQMMKETWQKLRCWKTFMKGELTTILSQYSDDFPRYISLNKKENKIKDNEEKNSLVRWATWKRSWLRFPTELARGHKSLELRFNLKQCDLVTVHKNWPGYFVNWQSSE